MNFLKDLGALVTVLETYRGRDRFIRLFSYAAMFFGRDGKTPAQVKWRTISAELGSCRVILRLFDDLPMLMFNLINKFGLKGQKGILRPLGLITSLLNQSFYPSEHIAWLRQKQILNGAAAPYLLMGLGIWFTSLLIEVMRTLIKMKALALQSYKLSKQEQLDKDSSGQDSSQNAQIKEGLKKLDAERQDLKLLLIQTCADFINAVSWMPPGFLWSQKLSPAVNGVIGMVASVIMLYRNWPSRVQ